MDTIASTLSALNPFSYLSSTKQTESNEDQDKQKSDMEPESFRKNPMYKNVKGF